VKVQPAAFQRTTLPIDLSTIGDLDTGRYHSVWFPDHLMNQLPDSLWSDEFTDLATVSHSPHRNLDAMTIIAAAAMLTKTVPLATSVTDTIRRHPVVLAQTALTLSHLSKGRFIFGVGCGEKENTVPYGMAFDKVVGRFEEALELINLFWHSDGPVRFDGKFFQAENARLDAELYDGKAPPIWIGSGGPRMLELTGRYADGWWPPSITVPEDYGAKLKVIRNAADRANRDPAAIAPAGFFPCYIGEKEEIDEVVNSTFVKAFVLQIPAAEFAKLGFVHPLGADWRGFLDFEPAHFPRERVLSVVKDIPAEVMLKLMPHGTPKEVARQIKAFVDAGLRVPRIHDYSGQAGLKFAAQSAAKVRAAEDELMRLVGDVA
jgi:phthiodiolone/phenolphthiodiolone dimycocerosates ketoreductase